MAGPFRVRTRKPHGPVRINRAHPLARDLAFYYYQTAGIAGGNATFYDAVTNFRHGTSATQTAITSTDTDEGGRTNIFCNNGSVANGNAFTNPYGVDTTKLTVFSRFKFTAKPASLCQVLAFGTVDAARGAFVGVDSNGFVFGGASTSGGMSRMADNVDRIGKWVNVAGSGDGNGASGAGLCWLNGVFLGSNFSGVGGGQPVTTVSTGRDAANYYNAATAELALNIGWTRILTNAEQFMLNQNPWALLMPMFDPRLFSLPGSGGNVYNVSIIEAMSAADLVSASPIFAGAIVEAAAAAEVVGNTAVFGRAIVESMAAAEVVSNGSIYSANIAEAPSLTDTFASLVIFPAVVAEHASAVEIVANTGTFGSTIGEIAAAADVVNTGGAIYAAAIAEVMNAAEVVGNTAVFGRAITEAANAVSVQNAGVIFANAIVEAGNASDAYSAKVIFAPAVVEFAAAADLYSCAAQLNLFIIEAANAQDAYDANAVVPRATACNTLHGAPRIRRLEGPARIRKLGGRACD